VPTILVVDDDAAICETLEGLLTDQGFDVMIAPDTIVGLDHFQKHPEIDLCLLDLMMPQGCPDGVALARSIKAVRPHLPVILMTGFYSAADRARGVTGVLLQKPFKIDELVTEINRQLRH
jgi:DNA-binding response OmpR family regulator